jgi:cobalt-zinc-cadmium resistance protein CzcA
MILYNPASLQRTMPEIAGDLDWQRSAEFRLSGQQQIIAHQNRKLERRRFLPEISLGYFNQTIIGVQNLDGNDVFFDRSNRFTGYQVGLAFPLIFNAQRARSRSAQFEASMAEEQVKLKSVEISDQLQQAKTAVSKTRMLIGFFESSALKTAEEAERNAMTAWNSGEISYIELAHIFQQNLRTREDYLNLIQQYNQAVLHLEYLTNQ